MGPGVISATSQDTFTYLQWPYEATTCINFEAYGRRITEADEDPRKNRKVQARWFREFLATLVKLLPVVKIDNKYSISYSEIRHRCRSHPLAQREWKVKLWKQAH